MSNKSPSTAVTKRAVVASLLSLFGGSVAFATDEGWYIGTGAGQSKIYAVTACSKLNGDLDPGFSCRERTTDTAARIFGGYRFNQYSSVEGGYTGFGKFAASASGTKSGFPASGSIILKASGLSVNVDGILPITVKYGLLGQLGIVRWRTNEAIGLSALGASTMENKNEVGVSLQIGGGFEYEFTRNVRARAEYVSYPNATGRPKIDLLLVSIVYRFG